ncbi:tRNA epoxyqueuosine(34) reductase QueG [Alginatibacterium sediminis]|uniref:Epoxyqueuosine reductase n=1 Tax=Alginatibacterium sediminis TaxID=2164068 RepID=A0A420E7S7_9ALTE|nr:tRNA epoxyqueuosine(34) reductase QueG [Alginatibacterium sediminis]
MDLNDLSQHIKQWGKELGFQKVGICDTQLENQQPAYQDWLDKDYHGELDYMQRNTEKRYHPDQLHEQTQRIISVRMDYLPKDAQFAANLAQTDKAYISRYALGRDYHKLMRQRLKQLSQKIEDYCSEKLMQRPFVDSAPVLERPIAEKAGIGWTGKHTLVLNEEAGSLFFLGELFTCLPLPVDKPIENQCGECVACITICPTQAIVAPYQLDARRCISYLTIEYAGIIPVELRSKMGNRIYGCDDCQLACPWNRFAQLSQEEDFQRRDVIENSSLIHLFSWSEEQFLERFAGSAIRRIGHQQWLRNIAVALGNAPYSLEVIANLEAHLPLAEPVLAEHIAWAIEQQIARDPDLSNNNRKTERLIRIIEKGMPRDA